MAWRIWRAPAREVLPAQLFAVASRHFQIRSLFSHIVVAGAYQPAEHQFKQLHAFGPGAVFAHDERVSPFRRAIHFHARKAVQALAGRLKIKAACPTQLNSGRLQSALPDTCFEKEKLPTGQGYFPIFSAPGWGFPVLPGAQTGVHQFGSGGLTEAGALARGLDLGGSGLSEHASIPRRTTFRHRAKQVCPCWAAGWACQLQPFSAESGDTGRQLWLRQSRKSRVSGRKAT